MIATQLTREGFDNLKAEHLELVNKKRPYAVERLKLARSMGDLSENSEYTAAKEELAFVEGRIQEIEEIIRNSKVVENQDQSITVEIGSHVTLESKGEREKYQIVGEFEADPMNMKLSNTSPIGKAILGKIVDDVVTVEIPAGKIEYKIVDIG